MASSARKIVIEFLGDDKSASRTARSVDGTTSKLGATFARVGKVAAVGLGAGLVVAGAAAVKFTQQAIDDQAAQEKLATTLRNTSGATDEQVASVEDWISAQGRAFGVTDDDLRPSLDRLVRSTHDVGEAQALASLAMDASAGTGKSLTSVSEALAKAHEGSTGALARLGIQTKNAAGETLSFDQITKNMAETFKGQAQKQADTTAGKMQRLKVTLSEAGEAIGYKLIPMVTWLADVIMNDVIPAVQKGAAWFREHLQPRIEELAAVVRVKFREIVTYIRAHMKDIKETIRTAVDIVLVLWHRFGSTIMTVVTAFVRNILAQLRAAFLVVRGLFRVIHGILTGDWRELWAGLRDIFRGVWQAIMSLVRNGLDILKAVMRLAWGIVRDIVRGAWEGIRGLVANGAQRVVDIVRGMPGKIANLAGAMLHAGASLIRALFDGIRNAASDVGGFVSGLASAVMEAVRNAVNSALDLPLEVNFDKGPIHIHATVIPAFAKGVTNFSGGTALVGEQGPELVELPRGSNVIPNNRAFGDGTGTLTVNLNLDGKTVQQVLLAVKRRNGNLALGLA